MKIPITFILAGLLAWMLVALLVVSAVHYPIQTLIIPAIFSVHKFIENRFFPATK